MKKKDESLVHPKRQKKKNGELCDREEKGEGFLVPRSKKPGRNARQRRPLGQKNYTTPSHSKDLLKGKERN